MESDERKVTWLTFQLTGKAIGGMLGFNFKDKKLISASVPIKVIEGHDIDLAVEELLNEFTNLLGEPVKNDEPYISDTSYAYNWEKVIDGEKTMMRLIVEKEGKTTTGINILVGKQYRRYLRLFAV